MKPSDADLTTDDPRAGRRDNLLAGALAIGCVVLVGCLGPIANPGGVAAPAPAPYPGDVLAGHTDASWPRLRDGWRIQSGMVVTATGPVLSTAGFADGGWYPTRVPSTVLAALVGVGVYKEPYKSDNLRRIPATAFGPAWWYRHEFTLPKAAVSDRVFLGFDGINYRANIWLNGQKIADEKDVRGTYRRFRLDVTSVIARAGKNALAVEVFRPGPDDLANNWWDWAFSPPDLNMGLFQDVYVRQTGPVILEDARITSRVASPARADVTITAVVTNASATAQQAAVAVALGERSVRRDVVLGPGESKSVVFDPTQDKVLAIAEPQLWWPVGMGAAHLHTLAASVTVGGAVSDQSQQRVGLREISSEVSKDRRLFRVNGQPVFLRGGGWSSDLLLRWDDERTATELQYTTHLGLNMLRPEGKLESDFFYDKADELGIVLLPGWMCCDIWEKPDRWTAVHRRVARASMRSQAARMRNHPSVAAFLIGSDKAPPPPVAAGYVEAMRSVDWPNAIIHAAQNTAGSGLKMTGPYDWVAPGYWLEDTRNGGAFGFNSETSPGAAIPEADTLAGFMSSVELHALWAKPDAPQFHAGTPGTTFETLVIFNGALAKRMGAPVSLDDYVRKAQLMNYEAERAQFEAYGVRKFTQATGVVHWLLNNPWPSLIWHLYDYSLVPAAGFYGAKKANEALHAVYSYPDRSVLILNHNLKVETGLTVVARLLDREGAERSTQTMTAERVEADGVARVGAIPRPMGNLTGAYFVDLELRRGEEVLGTNTYWLSTKSDVSDHDAASWQHTPTTQLADLTELTKLPPATVKVSVKRAAPGKGPGPGQGAAGGDEHFAVTLENRGKTAAFFTRMTLRKTAGGAAVAPVFWDDNYVTLRAGVRRTFTVRAPGAALAGGAPVIEVEGVNVARVNAHP